MVKQRECVSNFADAMEKRLAANDHKGGWENEDNDFLWSKLIEEISELRQEVDKRNTKIGEKRILLEGADVANIVMMIVDNNTWQTQPLGDNY